MTQIRAARRPSPAPRGSRPQDPYNPPGVDARVRQDSSNPRAVAGKSIGLAGRGFRAKRATPAP
jgi:hypothetical protein